MIERRVHANLVSPLLRLVALIFAILVFSASAYSNPVKEVFGFSVTPGEPLSDAAAEAMIEELFPVAEWVNEGLPFVRTAKSRSYVVDYGERGRLVVVDRRMSKAPEIRIKFLIERPVSIRLRHKIVIGTALRDWQILKRSCGCNEAEPFERTYLLRGGPADLIRGMAFYEGAFATIEWNADADSEIEASLERLTWRLARRLRDAYARQLAPIANGLDDGSPPLTRPDLPDPDHEC